MSHHDLKEIYWRSRRGMLELELKLVPFVRDCFAALSPELQSTYVQLLEEEDWQIYDWLQGQAVPEDGNTKELIHRIQGYAGQL
ncbi:MAG: succinate dehydrogenase assembly factor 2 [Pseudomonadales bacterium]